MTTADTLAAVDPIDGVATTDLDESTRTVCLSYKQAKDLAGYRRRTGESRHAFAYYAIRAGAWCVR